jgi:hypothetical protein
MWCFAGVFAKNDCAGRGFLRGKRGEVVVICVAKRESKSALKNGTAFFYEMRFIWLRTARCCELATGGEA